MLSCQKGPLFKRNLLYTAITRAKVQVTIIGDTGAINTCVINTETGKRATLLALRLARNASEETRRDPEF
ncbi:MAG: hypothetical protein IKG47_04265 [Oscillospiraceae bacterium]|nr:hypothetical protein [Oscillospiraceae bacterium]